MKNDDVMIDRYETSYELRGQTYTAEFPTLYKAALHARELMENSPYRTYGGEGLTITHNQYAGESRYQQHFTFQSNVCWTEYVNNRQKLEDIIAREKPVPKAGDNYVMHGKYGDRSVRVISSEDGMTAFVASNGKKDAAMIYPTEIFVKTYVPADELALQNFPESWRKLFPETPVVFEPERTEEGMKCLLGNVNNTAAMLRMLKEEVIDPKIAMGVINGEIIPEYQMEYYERNDISCMDILIESEAGKINFPIGVTNTLEELKTLRTIGEKAYAELPEKTENSLGQE